MSFDDVTVRLRMLFDRIGISAYLEAAGAVVKAESPAIDFGCGPGVLSRFAAFAGLETVFAIDRFRIVHAAKSVAGANGLTRVCFLACDGAEAPIDRKADVLVSEWIEHAALCEWMLEPLSDPSTKVPKAGETVVPERVS
ncbi:hypothetical protein EG835_04790 [bacterium]|nr:hypothetical protein [bacterium]